MVVSSLEQVPSHRDPVDGWPGYTRILVKDTCTLHMISSVFMGCPCMEGSCAPVEAKLSGKHM